jgi:hypothetical protein
MGVLMNPVTLEYIFGGYNNAFLQDLLTTLEGARDNGITMDEIIDAGRAWFRKTRSIEYESMMATNRMLKEWHANVRRCGMCGRYMVLERVNHQPCCMIGGPWKSMWSCTDLINCGQSIVSELEIWEEAAKYGLQQFYPPPGEVRKEQREGRRTSKARARQAAPARTQQQKPCCGK